MSLTAFLNNPLVRRKIKEYFPRPLIELQGNIKSSPISKSPKLIGTAIDYLIRFNIKCSYPRAKENMWMAEMLAKAMDDDYFNKYIANAKEQYHEFLITHKLSKSLVKSTIDLAKIDITLRSGGYYFPDDLGKYKRDDIDDLINIIKNIDFKKFDFRKHCVLNPNFGKATRLIGGADADLIIDNKLIDIKNIKKLSITREMLNQIIGYYFLGRIGKVKGISRWSCINEVGFFFPRYDILYTIPIDEFIIARKRDTFAKWFLKKVKKYKS